MKGTGFLVLVILIAVAAVQAQDTAAPVANPVSATVKSQLPRFSKNMVAAAEAMPADKYGFKPTPEMNSFGHLVIHIVQAALIALSDGWNDHYGTQAIYLRLNGILPPTAQPAPK